MEEDKLPKDIAYYENIVIEMLSSIHKLLGTEVTDVTSSAIKLSNAFTLDAEDLRKKMSKMASDLSVALIEARKANGKLSKEDIYYYERMKKTTEILGNLQYKLNNIIKNIKKISILSSEVSTSGMEFVTYIMDIQSNFRFLNN